MTKPAVFISSSREGLEIAQELGRQLESTATITLWSEAAYHRGKSVAESLTEVADRSDFAIFVLTPNYTSTTPEPKWSPRFNVIFELGFLAGRLGLSRTFVIGGDPERLYLPSDLAGSLYIPLSTSNSPDLGSSIAPIAAVIRRAIADIHVPRDQRSIEHYSCFISYSWKDQDFAARLHDDLHDIGVRSWLDAKELRAGDRWSERIERAIQAHDKMLLVLSHSSIQSSWVRMEVKNAIRLERKRQKTVLFPIRLDDAVFNVSVSREIDLLREKQIADFRHWQDESSYQRAFARLVRDLAINASIESERHS